LAPGPVRQTVPIDPDFGVAVTLAGSLFTFNPLTGVSSPAFQPNSGQEINAVEALPVEGFRFPLLFTANQDGSVSVLVTDDGQHYTELTAAFDTSLVSASALDVLEVGDDLFEVYLTDADDIQPIVLTLDLRAELVSVGPMLALVVTLLGDLPAEGAVHAFPLLSLSTSVPEPEVFLPLVVGQDRLATVSDEGRDDKDTVRPLGQELLAGFAVESLVNNHP